VTRGGRRGDGRFLQLRVGLFFVAAAFMLVAIFGGQDWAALVCIGVGAVALLLRFLPGGSPDGGDRGRDDLPGEHDAAP
jgi:hypothetical protein